VKSGGLGLLKKGPAFQTNPLNLKKNPQSQPNKTGIFSLISDYILLSTIFWKLLGKAKQNLDKAIKVKIGGNYECPSIQFFA
jgi:hypothetical protein